MLEKINHVIGSATISGMLLKDDLFEKLSQLFSLEKTREELVDEVVESYKPKED